ncbi:MAG: right-handed parallel beta-helix repeat-containing protein [Calditrichaceae bacterium]
MRPEILQKNNNKSNRLITGYTGNFFIMIIIAVLTLFMISSAFGATYYVNTGSGNDQNPGTSAGSAFKTIGKAANVMSAGDECLVSAGNYDERVRITRSGSKNAPIVYSAEEGAVCRGFTIKADYIHIVGFEITNSDRNDYEDGAGIHVSGDYNEIKNNYIHHVYREGVRLGQSNTSTETSNCIVSGNLFEYCGQAGIQLSGTNHLIENNEISHTVQWSKTNPKGLDADGMRFFGSGHIIRKNHIHDILLSDPENGSSPHVDAVQTWGPAYDIIFEQNLFSTGEPELNKQIFMVSEVNAPVKNLTFRNNIFYDNYRGLNIVGSHPDVGPSPIENISIVNNTFINLKNNAFELHDSPDGRVVNNIFYDCRSVSIDGKSYNGLEIGYNCYYHSDGTTPSGEKEEGDQWQVDPKFVNVKVRDYNLKPDSPLIDAGKILSDILFDFRDITRPQKMGYDIGAYEFFVDGSMPESPRNLKILK